MAERFRRTAIGRALDRFTPAPEPATAGTPSTAGTEQLLAYLNSTRLACGLAPVALSRDPVSAVPAPEGGPTADPLPLIGSDSGTDSDEAAPRSASAGSGRGTGVGSPALHLLPGTDVLPEPTLRLDAPTPLSGLDSLLRRLSSRAALLHPSLEAVAFRFQRYHPAAPSIAHAGTASQGRLAIRVEIKGFAKRRGTPGGRRLSLTGRLLSRRRRDSTYSPIHGRSSSPAEPTSSVQQGRAADASPVRRRGSFVTSPVPRMMQALSGAASPVPLREASPSVDRGPFPARASPTAMQARRRPSIMRPRGLSIPDLLHLDRGSPTPMGTTTASPASPTSSPTPPVEGPALAAVLYPPRDCVDVLLPRAVDGPFTVTATLFAAAQSRRRGARCGFLPWRDPVSVLSCSVERAPLLTDEAAPLHFARLECEPLVGEATLPAPPGWEQPPAPPCVELRLQGSALRPGDTIRVCLVLALEGRRSRAMSPAPPATQTLEWTFSFRPALHWHVGPTPLGDCCLPRQPPVDVAFAQARPGDAVVLQALGTQAPPRLEVGSEWDDHALAGAETVGRAAWRELAHAALQAQPRSPSLCGVREERCALVRAEVEVPRRGEVCMPLAAVFLPAEALEDSSAHLAVSARLANTPGPGKGAASIRYSRLAVEAYTRHWRRGNGVPSVLDYNDRVAAPGAPAVAEEAFLILPLSRVKECLELAPSASERGAGDSAPLSGGPPAPRVLYLRPAVTLSRDGVVACDQAPPGLAVELRVALHTLAVPEPGPLARIRSGFQVEGETGTPCSAGANDWAVAAAAEGQWSTSRVTWPCFRLHVGLRRSEGEGEGASAPESRRFRLLLEASGRDIRLGLRVPPVRLFDHRCHDGTLQTCLAWSSRAGPMGLFMVADLLPRDEPYWVMPAFPDWFTGEEGTLALRVYAPCDSRVSVTLTQHSMSANHVG